MLLLCLSACFISSKALLIFFSATRNNLRLDSCGYIANFVVRSNPVPLSYSSLLSYSQQPNLYLRTDTPLIGTDFMIMFGIADCKIRSHAQSARTLPDQCPNRN